MSDDVRKGESTQLFMSLKLKSWFRARFSGESHGAAPAGGREPSLGEVLLMLGTMFAVHLWAICRVSSFWGRAATWFDNECYLELVTTIRNWHSPAPT